MTYSEIISRVPPAKREIADAYLKGLAEGVGVSFNLPKADAQPSQTSERADLSETAWKELLK